MEIPDTPIWQKFKKRLTIETQTMILNLYGQTLNQKEFVRLHRPSCNARPGKKGRCGRQMYAFLIANNWIQSPNAVTKA